MASLAYLNAYRNVSHVHEFKLSLHHWFQFRMLYMADLVHQGIFADD